MGAVIKQLLPTLYIANRAESTEFKGLGVFTKSVKSIGIGF